MAMPASPAIGKILIWRSVQRALAERAMSYDEVMRTTVSTSKQLPSATTILYLTLKERRIL